MENLDFQSQLKSKLDELIKMKGTPQSLKKVLREIKKEIPSYFEKNTFLSEKELLKIVVDATGFAGWNVDTFDFHNNKEERKRYMENYLQINEEDLEVCGKNCISYILTRESSSKYELCGLEIHVQGIEVNITEQSLGASGTGFSCFRKDFEKEMKNYYKNQK